MLLTKLFVFLVILLFLLWCQSWPLFVYSFTVVLLYIHLSLFFHSLFLRFFPFILRFCLLIIIFKFLTCALWLLLLQLFGLKFFFFPFFLKVFKSEHLISIQPDNPQRLQIFLRIFFSFLWNLLDFLIVFLPCLWIVALFL